MPAVWSCQKSSASVTHMLRGLSTAANKNKVGFIGLGNMGSCMARNLLKAGHEVIAYDINTASLNALASDGATVAKTPQDIPAVCGTVITMLPSNPHVREVYLGELGVLKKVAEPEGTLFIDCSTCEPAVSKEVGAKAIEKGANLVDAPVSGGTIGAEQATLTFMVGGSADDFAKAEAVLKHMGKKIVHCGDIGMGQAAKLCNNLVLGISMAGVSEGHALAGRLGLDQKVLADILNTSSGRCWSSDTYNPCPGVMEGVPSARGYTGGFACDLMVKDLGLAGGAAMSAQPKLGLPMASAAMQLYCNMSARGSGHKDFSGIYELLSEAKERQG